MTESIGNNKEQRRASSMMKSMGIYAIGNLGSKVITFLMVPLYTHYVENTADFGYYDICLTVVFLLIPFVTLQLRDGAFRFLLDSPSLEHRKKMVSTTYKILGSSLLLTTIFTFCVAIIHPIPYIWYVLALLVAMSIQEVVSQVFRGLGDTKAFVAVGILSAFFIGLLSLVFVVWMGMGIKGVFLANILARFFAIAAVETKIQTLRRFFSINISGKGIALDIIKYTLPLLPGSLCWWLTGSSDRWFIQEYLGLEVNGVYAVAVRFVSILQTLALIFYQAWQETAILQYHSADRDKFFSQVLNNYIFIICLLLVGFCFSLKMCYSWLVDTNYQGSLDFIFPLAISAALFSVSAYFDMGYQCAKDTKRTLPAIIVSAVVNVVLNFLLIGKFGVYGVIATLIVSYSVLLTYRWIDSRRYFKLAIHRRIILPVMVCVATAIPFYLCTDFWQDALTMVVAIALMIACCPSPIRKETFAKITSKIRL
ncbi:MAG: lipopolysaccharide biosynthesis protein [Sodaliphilus sp.]